MKSMKKNIISKSAQRRILQYENRRGRQLLVILGCIAAIIAFLCAWCEPAGASGYGYGIGLAAMTGIASIADVSDKETHGSEIGYYVALIPVSMINDPTNFPQPESGSRAIAAFQLKTGETCPVFEAHTIPTLVSTTEKGEVTTNGTNTFVIVMGGDRDILNTFVEEFAGGKFVIMYKHIKDTVWNVIGEPERPMILNNTETKDDHDGRYTTLTFTRDSVYLPLRYTPTTLPVAAT